MVKNKLYLMQISLHGLIRAKDPELGINPDTGGQVKYLLEMIESLVQNEEIGQVDLLTRQIDDPRFSSVYADSTEQIAPKVSIIRLPFGHKRYIRKENLWPYIPIFVDETLRYLRQIRKIPDLIHTHYADAGEAGVQLSSILGVPHLHTGHSLGWVKYKRFIEQGFSQSSINKQYNIKRRIEAEEKILDNANGIIASSHQETESQYGLYDNYNPKIMHVIPPGVKMQAKPIRTPRISKSKTTQSTIEQEIRSFLKNPDKPCILLIARPDPRKNIEHLIHCYGQSSLIQNKANLVLIIGNRDKIQTMERSERELFTQLLFLIDNYNLYGNIAYPKNHQSMDIPKIYDFAFERKGIFINPALTEPFGLTLIEASVAGLPIIATKDGGPKEIIDRCQNGILINPLSEKETQQAILSVLNNADQWNTFSKNGLYQVHQHFSWQKHIVKYIKLIHTVQNQFRQYNLSSETEMNNIKKRQSKFAKAKRFLFCDIDNTLIGDTESLKQLLTVLKMQGDNIGFGVASRRHIHSIIKILQEHEIPQPDIIISSVGSEIYYGAKQLNKDNRWSKHIHYQWNRTLIERKMSLIKGITLQNEVNQNEHKISYLVDPKLFSSTQQTKSFLRQHHIHVNTIYCHNKYLDIIPIRCSKRMAVRYIAMKWDINLDNILVAGDSGNDAEMLTGKTYSVVVANYSSELESLKKHSDIYFAKSAYAAGILEGIEHFQFFQHTM